MNGLSELDLFCGILRMVRANERVKKEQHKCHSTVAVELVLYKIALVRFCLGEQLHLHRLQGVL